MPVVSPQMPPLGKASSLHKIRDGVAFDGIGGLNMSVHRLRKPINEVGSQRVASAIDSEERFSKVVTL